MYDISASANSARDLRRPDTTASWSWSSVAAGSSSKRSMSPSSSRTVRVASLGLSFATALVASSRWMIEGSTFATLIGVEHARVARESQMMNTVTPRARPRPNLPLRSRNPPEVKPLRPGHDRPDRLGRAWHPPCRILPDCRRSTGAGFGPWSNRYVQACVRAQDVRISVSDQRVIEGTNRDGYRRERSTLEQLPAWEAQSCARSSFDRCSLQ